MSTTTVAAPLAVSMGDPAGIGLDITLRAWMDRAARAVPPFVLFADKAAVAARALALNIDAPLALIREPGEAPAAFTQALPIIDVPIGAAVRAGAPDTNAARATIEAIERAVSAVQDGAASAIVTNPIAKSVLYESGFKYPGHTEFLAALAARHDGSPAIRPVMLLASEALRVVPLTIHIPLTSVPAAITADLLTETVRIVDAALRLDFGIATPRIAVSGLNPHAGENGSIGREDMTVIAPTLADLANDGITVTGPHSADTMFHADARRTYDVAICMYHDQALIPIKTLAFDEGVNVTLGLPFVRTSPDHGTAFSLAGSGKASAESFIASCKLAQTMAQRRRAQRALS